MVVAIRCKDAFKCITSRLTRIYDLASPAVSPHLLPCSLTLCGRLRWLGSLR